MAIQAANGSNQIHAKRSSQFSIDGHLQARNNKANGLPVVQVAFQCSSALPIQR
jgi:hypothetical protein